MKSEIAGRRTARAMSTKRTKREALGKEIADDALAKPRSKRKQTKARARTADEEDYLPDALSTKILREAKELREEVEAATSSEGSSRIREPARHPASRKAP